MPVSFVPLVVRRRMDRLRARHTHHHLDYNADMEPQTAQQPPIDNSTPVAALTVGQLKTLIADVVQAQMRDYEAALIEADEALWDAQFTASQDVLEQLSIEALTEDEAGLTRPLEELLREADEADGGGVGQA